MADEVMEGLFSTNSLPSSGRIYVDLTFGGGGHSRLIMQHLGEHDRLLAFDQDIDAYANRIDDKRFTFVHSNFRYLPQFMDYYGIRSIHGLLADLGVSFHHFDSPERGFSFRYDSPLDMRMNTRQTRTAADIVNTYSEEELARILYLYGEFTNSRALAKRIVTAREHTPIHTTFDLLNCTSMHDKHNTARLFQALRIEVNDEMGALKDMLTAVSELLAPGGRVAILTYHSLEDRIVKNFFRSGNIEGKIEKDFYGNVITPFTVIEKGRTASEEEVLRNPRARSAKLRVAQKR